MNPAGTRLYVANFNSNNVTVFSLDGSGSIVGGSGANVPQPAGATGARAIARSAAGTRLYVANFSSDNVTVFSLDGSGDIVGGSGVNVPQPARRRWPRRNRREPRRYPSLPRQSEQFQRKCVQPGREREHHRAPVPNLADAPGRPAP